MFENDLIFCDDNSCPDTEDRLMEAYDAVFAEDWQD